MLKQEPASRGVGILGFRAGEKVKNQQGAPEALRLADELAQRWGENMVCSELEAATELRRLHAENERLAALVEAQQPDPSEQQPFGWIKQSEIDSSKDFGGSINLWRQKYDCDVPVYLAQQPAPSAAAVVNPDPHAELRKTWQPGQRWQARSFRNGQWGPWTDAVASEPFWFPHQDYRRHPDDLAPQPSPTPQADSAPGDLDGEAFRTAARLGLTLRFYGGCAQSSMPGTPSAYEVVAGHDRATAMREAVERAAEVIAKGGEPQRLDSSAPQADSQPAPEYVGNGMFKGETIQKAAEHWANWCDVRCMTGLSEFLRVVAAQAPADSVTAPAAGAVAGPALAPSAFVNAAGIKADDKPGTVVRKLDAAFHDAVTFADAAMHGGALWCVNIQGPDDVIAMPSKSAALEHANDLNALFGRHPYEEGDPIMRAVVIEWPHSADSHAADLVIQDATHGAAPTPPTHAADSVLEDAARLLESQHTWLTNVAAANLVRSVAARKKGGAT